MPRQAVDRLRASPAPRLEPTPAGRPDACAASSRSWGARSGSPAGWRTSTSPTAGSAAVTTSSGYIAADVAILADRPQRPRHLHMLLRRGVPIEAKPFQFGVRIEQPQEQIDTGPIRHAVGASGAGRGRLQHVRPRREAATCSRFACVAGGYVMPSVSEPGYFCTNGMSESRHDSPFANSGLVVTIDPAEPELLIRWRASTTSNIYERARVPRRRPVLRCADPVGQRLPRRPTEPGEAPVQLPARGRPTDLDPSCRSGRGGCAACRWTAGSAATSSDATLTGPEARGSSPVRILRDPLTRQSPAWPASTPAAKGRATPEGSSAPPSTAFRMARTIVATYARS